MDAGHVEIIKTGACRGIRLRSSRSKGDRARSESATLTAHRAWAAVARIVHGRPLADSTPSRGRSTRRAIGCHQPASATKHWMPE